MYPGVCCQCVKPDGGVWGWWPPSPSSRAWFDVYSPNLNGMECVCILSLLLYHHGHSFFCPIPCFLRSMPLAFLRLPLVAPPLSHLAPCATPCRCSFLRTLLPSLLHSTEETL